MVKLVYTGVFLASCGLVAVAACSVDKDYVFSETGGVGGYAAAGRASSPGGVGGETASTRGGSMSGGGGNGTGARSSEGGLGGSSSGGGASDRGTSCGADEDCAERHCVDGVCCDSECAEPCRACISAQTGQPDGSCAGISAATDPDAECTKGDGPCDLDGNCDGAGACAFAGPSTECAGETCSGGKYTAAARCDGMGSCVSPPALSCDNCANDACEDTCTASTDCSEGFYCAESACAAKKVNGAPCEVSEECSSAQCVDGVCCDALCGSSCRSCLSKDTGKPDGTCSAVKAGTRDASCNATPPDACGYDGTCDSNGDCRNHVSGTPCSRKACVDGMRVVSSSCNGRGLCAPEETASCGQFGCYDGSCVTACASSAECSASAYCSGTTCVARKQAGATCSQNDECASDQCGGRCCTNALPCSCPEPQSTNLLKSPGFDELEDDWTLQGGPIEYFLLQGTADLRAYGEDALEPYDAANCPLSSGLFGRNTSGSSTAAQANRVSQCVALPSANSAYNFGADHAWGAVNLAVDLYASENCSGTPGKSDSGADATPIPWSAIQRSFQSENYKSVRFSIYTTGEAFILDQAFLSKAPAVGF